MSIAQENGPRGARQSLLQRFSSLLVLLVLFGVLAFSSGHFLSVTNLINVARQVSTLLIMSVGMTLVILTGGIDLSVGSVAALGGAIMAGMGHNANLGSLLAIFLGLIAGALVGLFNGFMVTKQKMTPFIVTLGTMTIARGMTYVYTGGYPVTGLPEDLQFLGQGYIGIIAVPTVIAIVIALITIGLLNFTKFGVAVYALGDNRRAARLVGIRVPRIETLVYVISGVCAASAGIIMTCRLNSAQPTLGTGWELQAIASVIIGGTSFMGGEGGIGGTIIGSIIMTIINNGLNLLNVSAFWQQIAIGSIILIAVFADNLGKGRRRDEE